MNNLPYIFEAVSDAWNVTKRRADALASAEKWMDSLSEYRDLYNASISTKQKVYAMGGVTQVLKELGKYEDAMKSAKLLLELNPNNNWAKNKIAELNGLISNQVDDDSVKPEELNEIDAASTSLDNKWFISEDQEIDESELREIGNIEDNLADVASDATMENIAESVEKSQSTTEKPDEKSFLDWAADIGNMAFELTGIPGLTRSAMVLSTLIWGENKTKFKNDLIALSIFDFIDFIYWCGVLVLVAMASVKGLAAGAGVGALAGGVGAAPGSIIGAILAGGGAAAVAFIKRIFLSKVSKKVAIKGFIKTFGSGIKRRWKQFILSTLRKSRELKKLSVVLKKNGIPRKQRKEILSAISSGTKDIDKKTFINAMKESGAKSTAGLSNKTIKAMYASISNMSVADKVSIIEKMGLGAKTTTLLTGKTLKLTGKTLKYVLQPDLVSKNVTLAAFKNAGIKDPSKFYSLLNVWHKTFKTKMIIQFVTELYIEFQDDPESAKKMERGIDKMIIENLYNETSAIVQFANILVSTVSSKLDEFKGEVADELWEWRTT